MKWRRFGPKLLFTWRSAVIAAQHLRIGPIMYEDHFGLNKRPFRALAAGSDVFVGPQTAATMAGFKKALTTPDAIIAVSGPTGVGKTTLVRRALDTVAKNHVLITLGRMQLGHDEVLEMLLEELGADMPAGTVQRFTRFRRMLKQHADKGTPVFVVVEDASRVGVDALSELEALTAADAGVSEGATVVLMGNEDFNETLKSPRLARVKQRLRLRQKISPLSAGELTAYFKHCFRLAGNEFDLMFEPGTADILHALTGGIPRMANTLVESVLASAAETRQDRIGVALIKLIATEEYGLEMTHDDPPVGASAEKSAAERTPAVPPIVDAVVAQLPEAPPVMPAAVEAAQSTAAPPDEVAADVPVLAVDVPPTGQADIEPIEQQAAPADDTADDSIPELIQDTLPDLAILAPDLADSADYRQPPQPDIEKTPETAETGDDDLPTLTSSDSDERDPEIVAALEAAQVGPIETEVPEWERDPTLAELRPDLDALEHAMAVAHGTEPEADSVAEKAPGADVGEADEPVPAITLDREIQAKIDEAAEILKQAEREAAERKEAEGDDVVKPDTRTTSEILAAARQQPAADRESAAPSLEAQFEAAEIPIAAPAAKLAEAPAKAPVAKPKAPPPMPNPELRQIAANISRAKTINDVDDQMAETLFGEEFSLIAAQIAANAPREFSANDEMELSLEESARIPLPDVESAAAVEIDVEAPAEAPAGKIDLSATQQRLATVRALNAGRPSARSAPENIVLTESPAGPTVPTDDHPESIEEQINTSITQTLQAINVRPPDAVADDDEDKNAGKSGFFSRFRRS